MSVKNENQETVTESEELISVYPNPFNSRATLSLNLTRAERTNISLFDLNGRQIEVLYDGNLNVGANVLQLDISNQSNGSYLIVVNSENQSLRTLVNYIK